MANSKDLRDTYNLIRLITGLAIIDGLICTLMLLLIPSDQQSAWLFGYSQSRITLIAISLIGTGISGVIFWWISHRADDVTKINQKLEAFLRKERPIIGILFFFTFLLILSLLYLLFTYTNLDYRVPNDAVTAMEQVKAYMVRLAPFALWSALLAGQILIALTVFGYTTRDHYLRVLQIISIIIWPIFIAIFWIFNKIDPFYYTTLTKEDNLVEWMSVFFFVITGILSLHLAVKKGKQYRWFFILFGLACFLFALEEISWGQRIFGLESTAYFLENSDQQEINVHNVINERFSIRTKHVAAFVLFTYGAVLPLIALNRRVKVFAIRLGVLIPPIILVHGYLLASFMTIDLFFSGKEEEIAELFFSILLFFTLVFQYFYPDKKENYTQPIYTNNQLQNQKL